MSYTELVGLVLGAGLVAAITCALLHRIVHRDTFRRYHEVGYAVFLQLGVIFAVLLAFPPCARLPFQLRKIWVR